MGTAPSKRDGPRVLFVRPKKTRVYADDDDALVADAAGAAARGFEWLTILHFNDVYNVEGAGKPAGGAARFAAALRAERARAAAGGRDALCVFSGDCMNPSIMSTVVRGEQMPLKSGICPWDSQELCPAWQVPMPSPGQVPAGPPPAPMSSA